MKLLPRLSLDQIGYPPGGPERSAIPQCLGTFLQAFTHFLQLVGLQPGFAAGAGGFAQRFASLLLPRLMPATDGLPMNAQPSGNLALMDTLIKEPGGFESPPFQLIKIPFDAFRIAHARSLIRVSRLVTILYARQ